MQIQSISNPSFSGLQFHPNYKEVEYIIATKYSYAGCMKADKLMEQLAKNMTSADVYVAGDMENPKIYAEVGKKLFKENFFNSPIRVLKKALKESNKLDSIYKKESISN